MGPISSSVLVPLMMERSCVTVLVAYGELLMYGIGHQCLEELCEGWQRGGLLMAQGSRGRRKIGLEHMQHQRMGQISIRVGFSHC
jgi:hypothetical protein